VNVTSVLDLDEDQLISVREGRAEARPLPSPLTGLPPDGPVVVVQSGVEPDLARLEELHQAQSRREIHACGRLAAAAAALAREGAGGVLLVCDATWTTLRAGLVEVDGAYIRVRRTVDLPRLGGRAFAEAAAPGLPGPARAALPAALTENPGRIAAVTAEAAEDPLYRDVPVAQADGHPVHAGALLEAVAGYRADLLEQLGPLQPADAAHTVLSGAFARFVLLPDLFATATGRDPIVRPDAVAVGAALLVEGRFREPAPEPVWVTLPLHRLHAGRFEETFVSLPSAGGSFTVLEGRTLLLGWDTDAPCDVLLGPADPLRVEIDGTDREIDLSGLPPARYQIGLRVPRRSAPCLVLLDPDGHRPIFMPLETRTRP
jgi:hypothetical protein